MAAANGLRLAPLGGALGLRVEGLDLRTLDEELVGTLRGLLLDRLALVFPEQHLSADEQRTLMRRFGDVERHPERPQVLADSDEEVVVIAPSGGVSAVWHCDYEPDFVPCGVCSLNMVECAADGGGDTIFVSNYRVWERLSEPMRRLLRGLTAVHRNTGNAGRFRDEALFPLVGVHAETGREGLLFSSHHVQDLVELEPEEAALVLERIRDLTRHPAHAIRLHWTPGTIALWDNRCAQHYAVPDFEGSRLLYQVTVRAPMPRPPAEWVAPAEDARARRLSDLMARDVPIPVPLAASRGQAPTDASAASDRT